MGLDLADVDLLARTIAVVRKGGARVLLELPEPTAVAIAAWVERRGTRAGALFVELMRRRGERQRLAAGGVYFIVRRLGENLGLRVRSHGLRHASITSVLTLAAERGVPMAGGCPAIPVSSRSLPVAVAKAVSAFDRPGGGN